MLFGGRVAEELIIGDISSGAQNDIQQANIIAKEMVISFGMGKEYGLRSYIQGEIISNNTQKQIDDDINIIINDCYLKAKDILSKNSGLLNKIAHRLTECEIINSSDMDEILKNE
jgi:ATP-dependent Zn protease